MSLLIKYTEIILFILSALSVGYIFIFSIASTIKRRKRPIIKNGLNRFAIIIPAYKEDKVIIKSVDSVLNQDYKRENFDVHVISQHMNSDTNMNLKNLCNVVEFNVTNSSKAKALQYFIANLDSSNYDYVIILDGDNIIDDTYLSQINTQINRGYDFIQSHRISKGVTTNTSFLDGVSEEINNSIYRKGHNNLGLSSALIGSGMIFPFEWFKENIFNVHTAGEDKELEILLHLQNKKVNYFEEAYVYDEKVSKDEVFFNQRRRWLSAQLSTLKDSIRFIPKGILKGQIDLLDKLLQWSTPPLVILLGILVIGTFITLFISVTISLRWLVLLMLLITSLFVAIPRKMINKQFFKAALKIPLIFVLMFLNLFRIKGATKKFIHTEHGE